MSKSSAAPLTPRRYRDDEAAIVVADPHSPPAIGEDDRGSPSKQKRKRPFKWESDELGETNAKERRNCRRICIVIVVLLLLGLIGGIVYYMLFVYAKIYSLPGSNGSTVSRSALNYTLCREGWEETSYQALEDDDEAGDQSCKTLTDEDGCKVAISCCWAENTCVTYKDNPECNSLTTQESCEARDDLICSWRSSINRCRRGDRLKENRARVFTRECSRRWVMSAIQPDVSCASYLDGTMCSQQFGCCWDDQESGTCSVYKNSEECSAYTTASDCETDRVEMSGDSGSTTLCTWTGSKCVRGPFLVTKAPGGAKTTRHPTAAATKTKSPTRAPVPTTGRPTTKAPTSKSPTKKSTGSPTKMQTSSPTSLPIQTKTPTTQAVAKSPTLPPSNHPSTTKPSNSPSKKLTSSPATERPTTSSTLRPTNTLLKRKTSFLIMLADDMGWGDVSYAFDNGYYSTPNIDAMAQSSHSLQMTRFHSAAVACSPTRASLLSVRSPIRDCVWGANARWDKPGVVFRPEFPFQGRENETLGSLAKQNGYRTLYLGKWHIGMVKDMAAWGFDSWIASGGNLPTFDSTCFCSSNKGQCFKGHYSDPAKLSPNYGCDVHQGDSASGTTLTNLIVRNQTSAGFFVSKFGEFLATLEEDRSFFTVLAFNEPHIPFIGSPWTRAELLKGPTGNVNSATRSRAADYHSAILAVDAAVGKARQFLADYGRSLDTLVVFASDNGPEEPAKDGWGSTGGLKGHKRSLFEGGHRVPGIIEWPKLIRSNIISSNLISMMDVSATVVELILQNNYSLFKSVMQSKDGESLLESLLIASETGAFQFDRLRAIQMCSTTPGGSKRACSSLATMMNNFKLISTVKLDGSIDRASAILYDYESSEDVVLPKTHPKWQELVEMADSWSKEVVQTSTNECVFPPADEDQFSSILDKGEYEY